jgi:hypothetical protein
MIYYLLTPNLGWVFVLLILYSTYRAIAAFVFMRDQQRLRRLKKKYSNG